MKAQFARAVVLLKDYITLVHGAGGGSVPDSTSPNLAPSFGIYLRSLVA